jgi:hypothetical protein
MDVQRLITIVLPIAAAYLVAREALLERAKLKPGSTIFPTILSLRILSIVGPAMFLYGSYQIARAAQVRFDYFLAAIMVGFAILTVYTEQGTISVSDDGILFRRWYGLRTCNISWKDVRSKVSSKVFKTITVFSNDGRSIVHTQWHVAPSAFGAVLLRRLKDNFFRR